MPPVGAGEIADDVEGGDTDEIERDMIVHDGTWSGVEMGLHVLFFRDREHELGKVFR